MKEKKKTNSLADVIRDRGHVVADKLKQVVTTIPEVIDDDDARGVSSQVDMEPVEMELDDLKTQCHSLLFFNPNQRVSKKRRKPVVVLMMMKKKRGQTLSVMRLLWLVL